MSKFPHWTIVCIALGAFLLPITGGHLSIEAGKIIAGDNVLQAILTGGELNKRNRSKDFDQPACSIRVVAVT